MVVLVINGRGTKGLVLRKSFLQVLLLGTGACLNPAARTLWGLAPERDVAVSIHWAVLFVGALEEETCTIWGLYQGP